MNWGVASAVVRVGCSLSDLRATASSFPPGRPSLLCAATNAGQVFSRACCSARGHAASQWLDLAEGRLRLDRLSRNGGGATFFPWPPAIPRGSQESRTAAILRCAPARRAGASSIASGLQIAIEAAVVAGSKQPRRSDMANIGSFKKSGSEFQGEIVTLSVQTKNVRIVPEANRANDNAPSHRVFVGRAEIGAAWSKRSNEGRDYLSVKLDDPSFNAPIYANLFDDEDGDGFTLIWSRARRPNGD
jgi:uncharacterized protein (DUF736 family)